MENTKLNNILREIRLSENREAADGMERMGLKYHKNFGVSLRKLGEIAGKYKPDRKLAEELRQKNFRETLILSFMTDDTDKITEDDMFEIFNVINTQELAEQFVLNIAEKNVKFYKYIQYMLSAGNEFLISAAFVFLSRIALKDKNVNDNFFESFFEKAVYFSNNESLNIRKSAARFLRQTALRNEYLKKKVLYFCDKIKNEGNKNSQLVYEETVPLINY